MFLDTTGHIWRYLEHLQYEGFIELLALTDTLPHLHYTLIRRRHIVPMATH